MNTLKHIAAAVLAAAIVIFVLFVLASVAIPSTLHAQTNVTVTLTWDAPDNAAAVPPQGYYVQHGASASSLSDYIDVKLSRTAVVNVPDGASRHFEVRAYILGEGGRIYVGPPATLDVSLAEAPKMSALMTTRTCILDLGADAPPDATGGWGVQFARKLTSATSWTNHGSRDTSAPYVRSATVNAGAWDTRAVWSKSGAMSATLTYPAINCGS